MKKLIYLSLYLFLLLCPVILYADVLYKWKPVDKEFDRLAARLEETTFLDDKKSELKNTIDSLYYLAELNKNQTLLARALYWEAWKEMNLDVETTSKLINRALMLVDSIQYKYDYIRFKSLQGDVLRKSGQWLETYRIYKKQRDYYEKEQDWFYLAKTDVVLGVLFYELTEFAIAMDYFQSAQRNFQKIGADNCFIKNKINISNVMYQMGEIEETLDILSKLQEEPIVQNDTNYLINVMISYSTMTDCIDKAYQEKAHWLALESKDNALITKTLIGMGYFFISNNQPDSALYYYHQANQRIDNYTNTYDIFTTLKNLSQSFDQLGNMDSAYYYLKQYESVHGKILAQEKITELSKLESRSKIEQYESEIRLNEEKVRQQRLINRLVIIATLGLLLLLAYIYWLSRKKMIIEKQLKESENENLLLQNKQLQYDLDSKNRELASKLLNLSEKNKGFKTLLDQTEDLITKKAIVFEDGIKLKKQIKQQLSGDDEWKYFKLHFEKVHPEFFTKLKETYPKLSSNDLRLCAYIRIGMTNKEIAQIWSVLPETIITTRYRLRKKLHLEHDESLEDLLRVH